MKIPLSALGMVDIDTKNIPKKAWIIVAWALFILSVGMAVSFARWGGIKIIRTAEQAAEKAALFYGEERQ